MRAVLPLLSIPSPGSSTIEIGPLSIHFYGLTLLVAIAAAVAITGVRWTRRGGDWDLIFRVAVWGVASGIVGARLYHVVTSWDELPDEWWGPFAIWKGGLGVWGGIGLGCVVGAIVAHRSGASVAKLADCVAPALLVAQGIGRFGNWWNQELFGKPTDLPWGLEIDPENRPIDFVDTGDVPSHLPLRGALVLRCRRAAAAHRAALQGAHPARQPVRPVRARLQHRPCVDRDAAHRPFARDRRRAPERLRRGGGHLALGRVLRRLAEALEARRRRPAAEGRDHGGAEGAVAGPLSSRAV